MFEGASFFKKPLFIILILFSIYSNVNSEEGKIKIGAEIVGSQQLALLEENEHPLEITALEDCQFVVAMTEPWAHPIVQHFGQIHTSTSALKIGSAHIQKTKQELINQLNREATQA